VSSLFVSLYLKTLTLPRSQNICHSAMDAADADQRAKDQGLASFTDHPPRKWFNEFVGPEGPMIDITRRLHPTRKSMYTCEARARVIVAFAESSSCPGWNTKIDGR
jgi:hypothetical protein